MSALERLALKAGAVLLLLFAAWFWHRHELAKADQEGYYRAVRAGEKQREIDRQIAELNERTLRANLQAADAAAFQKEQQYAYDLEDAQRRMRAGLDRLRCPASPVHVAAAPADRPAAVGPAVDEPGEAVVPTVAVDILGLAGDTARLVRKYERLEERFEACRALNNGPATPAPAE